jgi:hypothetical protein
MSKNFPLYSPHSSETDYTQIFSTTQGKYMVHEILKKFNIGMIIHTGSFNAVKMLTKQLPIIEGMSNEYKLEPAVHTELKEGIELPFDQELTKENVYKAIIKHAGEYIYTGRSLKHFLKASNIQPITKSLILSQLNKEKNELLESYTKSWENGTPLKTLSNIKELINDLNQHLSQKQKIRIRLAIKLRNQKEEAEALGLNT